MSIKPGQHLGGIVDLKGLRNRCRIDEDTDCHYWTGYAKDGDVQVWIHALHRAVSASAAIGYLTTGALPKRGTTWYSLCHHATCLNPEHRKLGTLSEAWQYRRPSLGVLHKAAIARSTRKVNGKITEADAAALRISSETDREAGARLGIHFSQVNRIRNGDAWGALVAQSSVFSIGGQA